MKEIAKTYHKFLTSLDWEDEMLIGALRHGLGGFLSQCFIRTMKGQYKHKKSHYISPMALEQVNGGDPNGLIYEHMVPKSKYIQRPCEELAKRGELTVEFIEEKLEKYWYLATITAEEDARLDAVKMPESWDGDDIFARYHDAGIELVENPLFIGERQQDEPTE